MKYLATILCGTLCTATLALGGSLPPPSVVPEPDSMILLGTIAVGLGAFVWSKGRKGR